jgi:uncharacterized protein HemX
MEGKKIAFILVAIATVGGIAYYFNKRNKQVSAEVKVDVNKPTKQRVLEMQKQLAKTIDAKRDAQKEAPQVFVDDNPEGRLKR